MRKEVKQGSASLEERYYIGAAEYKDGALVHVMHDYGRITKELPCDQNQFITAQLATDETYYGDHIISNSSVVPVGNTIFRAQEGIILNEEFTVSSGKVYEAYIDTCTASWQYEYALKDHLGNTRVVFSEDGPDPGSDIDILQESHYYPFGMEMTGEWQNTSKHDYNYLYNGKELHKDFSFNMAAYGARYYDPAIAQFTGVDPLTESYDFQSTYAYAANNPISNIDILGMAAASTQDLLDDVWAQGSGTYDNDGNRLDPGDGWPNIGAIISDAVDSFWQSLGFGKDDAPSTSTTMAFASEKADQLQTVVDIQTAFMGPTGVILNPGASGTEKGADLFLSMIPGMGFSDDVFKFGLKHIDGIDLLHSAQMITSSAKYAKISKLTDSQLIESVMKPADGRFVIINTRTGGLINGNTRLFELKKRGINIEIPFIKHNPDMSMFID